MTIKIEDNIDDLTAVSLVKQVIEQGKISDNGNSYCYLSVFGNICVETRQHRKSPCFRVYKKNWVMSNKEQENRDYDKQIEEDYYKYWELIDYDDWRESINLGKKAKR